MTQENKKRTLSPLQVEVLLNETDSDITEIANVQFQKKEEIQQESEGKPQKIKKGPWTQKEHDDFLRGYQEVGKKWTIIANNYVKTRNGQQVACHGQKYLKKLLKKEMNIIQYHQYEIDENEKLKKNKL